MDRTIEALELALQLLAALEDSDGVLLGDTPMPGTLSEIRDTITGAMLSLKQRPVQIGGAELAVRLHKAVRAAGSYSCSTACS